ncbi:hypothetical protein B0I35DRAFT_205828 [Stachybotrys elegans]|uniref:Uncharacterized protein n=1 Tax=Stachybotrys elegans TaxID=80388 RepID=A0A8K0SXQ8_9HYPO|nr:hypothetical protein B0I35DRAFT_205828 [Stachybotrys elegans]
MGPQCCVNMMPGALISSYEILSRLYAVAALQAQKGWCMRERGVYRDITGLRASGAISVNEVEKA